MPRSARHSLELVFQTHRPTLIRRLMRLVGCAATAEDLVHESYLRVVGAMERQPVEHVPSFLFQTAHNLALDHLRRQRRSDRLFDRDRSDADLAVVATTEPSPEGRAADRETVARLLAVLAELPERQRQVLLLGRVEGLSYPQIAARLGVSENTVYKDMRAALARCLVLMDNR
ncbi:RNA polymerase sigma factor [Caenispirillum bisanense]|uniref:RNA polymerase sigma-70 factor, ECF subfamily n=1 Tax=Caenispirillum bisanense TaxID=414052 RepID=A0A286GK98_9PROT|nr:sigma-70 family RNA polymerase sigma factor [Caenispirillum bisanense]SOD95958.1 RNA polymerase sigma-70 factor, ECF subfamily [Caenispirillum bisanense]